MLIKAAPPQNLRNHGQAVLMLGDGTSRVTEYEHQFSQVRREVDEAGVVTRHQYDSQGNRIRTIEAEGNRHQPTTIQYPTFQRELRYDTRGRTIIQIDRWQEGAQMREQTSRTFYDARGRFLPTC